MRRIVVILAGHSVPLIKLGCSGECEPLETRQKLTIYPRKSPLSKESPSNTQVAPALSIHHPPSKDLIPHPAPLVVLHTPSKAFNHFPGLATCVFFKCCRKLSAL